MEAHLTQRAARKRRACGGPRLAHSIWFLVLTVVYVLASPHPVLAANRAQSLVLLCPHGGSGKPQFQNQKTGKVFPISDPRLRAVAEKACSQGLGAAPPQGTVNIANETGATIYVGFTGSITWAASSGCTSSTGGTEKIGNGITCEGTVTAGVSSRFCASSNSGALNCNAAQMNHLTNIETNFVTASNGITIWYDISVIPFDSALYCTDASWFGVSNGAGPQCAGAGGASYNFPVSLSCSGEPTYTCKGPPDSTHGPEEYPSQCGNPNATCACGSMGCAACPNNGAACPDTCVAAYFYPMFVGPENTYQPNAECPPGQTLVITFLAGP